MSRQPHISVLKNPSFGYGLWPWSTGPVYVTNSDWPFVVNVGDGKIRHYTVPAGYEFDGASVPTVFWGFPFGYTPFGLHIAAALEHDFLCDLGKGGSVWLRQTLGASYPSPVAAIITHAHFARRLQEDGLRPSQTWMMGTAVKWFGPRWKL